MSFLTEGECVVMRMEGVPLKALLHANGRAELQDSRTGRPLAAGSWSAIWAAARLIGGDLTLEWTDIKQAELLVPAEPFEVIYDGTKWMQRAGRRENGV